MEEIRYRFVPVTDPVESAAALRATADRIEQDAPDLAAKYRASADAVDPAQCEVHD